MVYYFASYYEEDGALAEAFETKKFRSLTINLYYLDEKTDKMLVSYIEHEATHLLEDEMRQSMELEYRAWSAEFILMDAVYGDESPWKGDQDYLNWLKMSKEEYKIYLQRRCEGYETYSLD